MKTVNYSCRLRITTRLFLLGLSALLAAWSPLAQAVQSVTLAWDRSTDTTVTGYKVYYTDVAAGTTSSVNAGNVTSYAVANLTDTKTYSFYAVAYNSSGVESVPSNLITYTVPGVNTAPTISTIANQSATQNISTAPIAFTVGDSQTAAGSLTVSGASSNPTLVPNANIVFGGSGASRTVSLTPAFNQTGTATITLTVSDGSLTAKTSFVLTVNVAGPFTPVYLAIEAESATLVSPMAVSSDPTASGGQSIASPTSESGTATFAIDIPVAGDYVVWCRNLSPGDSNDSIYVSADGGVEDIYDTVLGTTWLTTWQWSTVNGRAAGAYPRIFSLNVGRHSLVFRARESNTALDQLLVTNDRNYVPGANTAPTISSIADLSTAQNTATAAIAFTVGDAQTAAGSLTVSGASSNPTLVPTANIVFGGSGANRTVTVTPALNQTGTATITVTVSDGNLTASDSFVLTVNATANTAPTISSIANRTINEDNSTGAVGFTVGDSQTAAGSLTVNGSSSNPTLVPTANIVFGGSGSSRTVTVTPAANQSGTATITVTVSDGSLTANTSFTLTVSAVNDAPTISSIANQTISAGGTAGPIAFTIGDLETAAGSLTLSGSSSNPTLAPNSNIVFGGSGANRTVTVTPAAGQSGTATITVTVSDGSASASVVFTLTVSATANTAPTISSIADQTTAANTATAAIPFTVGDAQTAAGSLTVSGASSNPTLVPNANIVFGGSGASRTVTVTPAANQTGTATITVTVSDGSLTASDSFVLTVSPAGPFTPVYLAIEAESATLASPMAVLTDPNAAGGKYIASSVAQSGTATFALNIPDAGDYVVWCKFRSIDDSSDSFFVSMDGGVEDIYDTVLGTTWSTDWLWSAVNGRTAGAFPSVFSLSAGQHSLVFRGREANAALDQLLVTNDRSYVPDVIFTITTPTPLASSITLDPAGFVTVTWPAVPGKTYQVQYKTAWNDPTWTPINSTVTADSTTASQSDYVVGNRFYQVVEIQ